MARFCDVKTLGMITDICIFCRACMQLIGALNGAPGAMQVEEVGQNLAINLSVVALSGWLLSRDLQVGTLSRKGVQSQRGYRQQE